MRFASKLCSEASAGRRVCWPLPCPPPAEYSRLTLLHPGNKIPQRMDERRVLRMVDAGAIEARNAAAERFMAETRCAPSFPPFSSLPTP